MSCIHKTFSKEIVKRAKLRYRFFKDRMGENKEKQQNYHVSLLCKTKKECYGNIDEEKVSGNKKFWKTVKPFLSFSIDK